MPAEIKSIPINLEFLEKHSPGATKTLEDAKAKVFCNFQYTFSVGTLGNCGLYLINSLSVSLQGVCAIVPKEGPDSILLKNFNFQKAQFGVQLPSGQKPDPTKKYLWCVLPSYGPQPFSRRELVNMRDFKKEVMGGLVGLLEGSLTMVGGAVMTDRVFYAGKFTDPYDLLLFRIADFMRYCKEEKIGLVSASTPLINPVHQTEGSESVIQSYLWIPPSKMMYAFRHPRRKKNLSVPEFPNYGDPEHMKKLKESLEKLPKEAII